MNIYTKFAVVVIFLNLFLYNVGVIFIFLILFIINKKKIFIIYHNGFIILYQFIMIIFYLVNFNNFRQCNTTLLFISYYYLFLINIIFVIFFLKKINY